MRETTGTQIVAGFDFRRREGARLLVREGFEGVAEVMLDSGAGRIVSSAGGGREPHPVIDTPGDVRILLRRYRRGGALRRLNRDRYFLPGRAFREVRATEHAARAGVRVPTIVGAAERRRLVGYTAAIASIWLEGARELAEWLRSNDEEEKLAALRETGSQVAAMHNAGVAHPDLNLANVLVVPGADPYRMEIYLIDFDRATLHPRAVAPPVRRSNLLRFGRSARKMGVPLGRDEWAAVRKGYGAPWPLSDNLG